MRPFGSRSGAPNVDASPSVVLAEEEVLSDKFGIGLPFGHGRPRLLQNFGPSLAGAMIEGHDLDDHGGSLLCCAARVHNIRIVPAARHAKRFQVAAQHGP
jgi:hypothetical protein